MPALALLLLLALPAALPPAPSPTDPPADPPDGTAPWSVRMAEAVMARSPVLMNRWHYEKGTLLMGFLRLYEATGEARYLDFIRRNIDLFVEPDGSIRTYTVEEYNLDQINAGKLLFPLYAHTGEARYREALRLLRRQLAEHPRTSEGGFWHKQIYPYQMWLDGLYMAAPFYAQYGATFDEPAAFDDVALQFTLITRYTREPATGLFRHAWDETRSMFWADSLTGLSAHVWGRAMGWFAMALVDVLDFLPEDHPERPEIVRIFRDLAEAVARVQDPVTGTWYQVLDLAARKGNYREASATAMFVYALARGVRLGHLDERFAHVARRGYRGLLREFIEAHPDGRVDMHGIVAVAGLGGRQMRDGSFAYYMSEPIVSNDYKGVGPFIMASVEIEYLDGLRP